MAATFTSPQIILGNHGLKVLVLGKPKRYATVATVVQKVENNLGYVLHPNNSLRLSGL